jgi:hypothetical protein
VNGAAKPEVFANGKPGANESLFSSSEAGIEGDLVNRWIERRRTSHLLRVCPRVMTWLERYEPSGSDNERWTSKDVWSAVGGLFVIALCCFGIWFIYFVDHML